MHYRDKQGRFQQVRWYVGDLKDTADGPRLQVGTAIGAVSVPATTRHKALLPTTGVVSCSAGIPTFPRCVWKSRASLTA